MFLLVLGYQLQSYIANKLLLILIRSFKHIWLICYKHQQPIPSVQTNITTTNVFTGLKHTQI